MTVMVCQRRVISGRYTLTTGRRWWIGGSRFNHRLAGLSVGAAGHGWWFAVLPPSPWRT